MIFGEIGNLVNNASSSTLPQDTTSTDYKQEFLQLLMTNLRHQDPTKPFDSSQMIAQQAEFASLEQMSNLNKNLVTLMAMENVTQSAMLLGKTVTGKDGSGTVVTGVVEGLSFGEDGTPTLSVNVSGTLYTMSASNISEIKLTP